MGLFTLALVLLLVGSVLVVLLKIGSPRASHSLYPLSEPGSIGLGADPSATISCNVRGGLAITADASSFHLATLRLRHSSHSIGSKARSRTPIRLPKLVFGSAP